MLECKQVFQSFLICDKRCVRLSGSADNRENDSELVLVAKREARALLGGVLGWRERETALSRKQWVSVHEGGCIFLHHAEQLSENAADGPDVDSRAVVLFKQDNFGGSVPSGDDVARELSLHVSARVLRLYQAVA